jgi:hypothetical protein
MLYLTALFFRSSNELSAHFSAFCCLSTKNIFEHERLRAKHAIFSRAVLTPTHHQDDQKYNCIELKALVVVPEKMSGEKITKINPSDAIGAGEDMTWLKDGVLNIVVVGASGDLAKKKTFPSLLNLFDDNLLPAKTAIWGYARSNLSDDDLRDRLRPFLEKSGDHSQQVIDEFLSICRYQSGNGYGDVEAFSKLSNSILVNEQESPGMKEYNRMFYFAIPPNVFADTATAIKQTCMQDPAKGFSRVIVEKPFGRDTESFEKLNKEISDVFNEDTLYRIDRKSTPCLKGM